MSDARPAPRPVAVDGEGGGAVVEQPTDAAAGRGARRWGAARRLALAHPLPTVALAAALGALLSAVHIWRSRTTGSLDPDESGYLATALRYHRVLAEGGLTSLVEQVRYTTLGPLVPLLSLPLLLVGPRDPRAAMLVQPVLQVALAVASAGIARRLVGPAGAILAGCSVAAAPTVLLASQSYWYGLGAAVVMAGALWALLASDRLRNRWWIAAGVLLGLLPLARTMALGFVPAVVLAGLVLAGRDRRSLANLAKLLVVAALVGGPWLVAQHQQILDYLLGYGYGERAAQFGSGGPAERLVARVVLLCTGTLLPLVLAAWPAWLVARDRAGWRGPWSARRREATALVAALVVGLAALASTSNQGVWFELPLVAIVVPLWVLALQRLPIRVRRVLVAWMVVGAVALPVVVRVVVGGHAEAALAQYDPRFDDGRAEAAGQEWDAVRTAVVDRLGVITENGERGVIVVIGNMELFNSNDLLLGAELQLWWPDVRVIDSYAPRAERAAQLTPYGDVPAPDGARRERVLVVVRHPYRTFTPDGRWPVVERQARKAGWVEVDTFALPTEGEVAIYRTPTAIAARPLPGS